MSSFRRLIRENSLGTDTVKMRVPHEIIGWIQRQHGFSSPTEWVRVMASRLQAESNQSSPPVILREILRNRNINVQFVPNLEVEGRLIHKTEGFTVLLNEKLRQYKSRARFTTAHEIGHTLFYDCSGPTPQRAVPRYFNNAFEELICNLFAGELLMPYEYLQTVAAGFHQKSEPDRVAILEELAESCAVAREVVACHLVRTLQWWDSILIFTAHAGKRGPWDATDRTRRIIWFWYPSHLDGKLYIPGNRGAFPKIKLLELREVADSLSDKPRLENIRSSRLKIGNLSTVLDGILGEEAMIWAIPSASNMRERHETMGGQGVLLAIPLVQLQSAA